MFEVLSVILAVSLVINGLFVWYCYRLLQGVFYVQEHFDEFIEDANAYAAHLKALYETPTFVEEPALKALIDHTRTFYDRCTEFGDAVRLGEPIDVDVNTEDSREEQQSDDEQKAQEAQVR
tara:strand:- start:1370 stop:1732 length:363 start_codon:yes stop_codon:yes gene_type:complete